MSGVNYPLYTHSPRVNVSSVTPPLNPPLYTHPQRVTMSSVTPPLYTHSPGYNNTPFSARQPRMSSGLLQDGPFLELFGINGGFMPVPDG